MATVALKFSLVISVFLFSFIQVAKADDRFEIGKTLVTPTHSIISRQGSKSECLRLQNFDTCQLLEINGKPTISEYYVNIDAAIPSKFNTNVVFATGSTGGNACCEYHFLIDLTANQPIVLKVVSLPQPYQEKPVIVTFDEGFTYENYGDDKGPLGERLWKLYRYKYGSGKLEVLKSSPKYSYDPLDKKKYPDDILNDPVNRVPLVKVLGKENYLRMRERFDLQMELAKVSNGIYVGKGCMAHMCGSEEGIFVLDSIKKEAWALYIEDEKGRTKGSFFGALSENNTQVKRIFDTWLAEHKISWNQIVSSNTSNTPVDEGVRIFV
jgi:hypothetical protein